MQFISYFTSFQNNQQWSLSLTAYIKNHLKIPMSDSHFIIIYNYNIISNIRYIWQFFTISWVSIILSIFIIWSIMQINIVFRTTFTYEQYFHRFTIPPYTFYEYNKTVSVKFSSSISNVNKPLYLFTDFQLKLTPIHTESNRISYLSDDHACLFLPSHQMNLIFL